MKKNHRQKKGYGSGSFRGRHSSGGRQWNGVRSRRGGGLFRSRQGIIMGVCKGISDYFNIPVFWVRLVFVLALLFSGLWPVLGIYILASFILKPSPVKPLETEDEKDFYNTYVNTRTGALRTLKNRFDALERRIRRMEDAVTTREFDWDQKFNS